MFQPASTLSGKNRSVRTVMISQDVESLCRFYEKFGLMFIPIMVERRIHHICSNATLSILEGEGSKCLGGLGIYEASDNEEGGELQKYNEGNTLFYGRFLVPRGLKLPIVSPFNPNSWISVIRSENIHETRNFYQDMGQWDLEKHGGGPEHYALVHRGNVFELYPLREGGEIPMEYIAYSDKTSGIHYDPDGRRILLSIRITSKIKES